MPGRSATWDRWLVWAKAPVTKGDDYVAITAKTTNIMKVAFANPQAATEVISVLNDVAGSGSPSSPVTPVALTFTAGGIPSAYTSPTGAVTIANSTTPTVVELLDYCNELRGNVAALEAVLLAQGLVT
jgi:hypothetical protein